MNSQGNFVYSEEDISAVLGSYFEDLFTSSNPVEMEPVANLLSGRITQDHIDWLQVPFDAEEVKAALFQMHPTKAPGQDGKPALFFQKYWHIVGGSVTRLVLEVLNEGRDPGSLNHTLIALIPKIKKPICPSDFRPISLCNVIFKIITKTIANRLKYILPDLIDDTQSAFVPGRLITDNAMIAHECFHYLKNKKSGQKGFMSIKLDMAKAYDRLEWPFIICCLEKMGFPKSWTDLIYSCISTVSFSILVNGSPYHEFSPQRGLRQGDPLSPYLFILCAEAFSAMIKNSVDRKLLHGLKIANRAPPITHLFFADDSIIFSRATVEEASHIVQILNKYEQASGQKINLNKSEIACSRNVPSSRIDALQQVLSFKAVVSHDKYLGLPALIGKSKTQIFDFVRDRVWKKLKGWKEKSLSRAGRETLIKSVAQAIPAYVMTCFKLPSNLCKKIDGMISRFFWSGDADKQKMHWINWRSLSTPKRDGGLGFRHFEAFNAALLAKQWWRLGQNGNSLMARTLKARYFPRNHVMEAKKGFRPSYIWSSIYGSKNIIQKGSIWKVGSGQTIRIWEDPWLLSTNDGLPHTGHENPYNLVWVSDLINTGSGDWNRPLIFNVFSPTEAALITKIRLSRRDHQDKLMWKHTDDGMYSVRSGYQIAHKALFENASTSSSRLNNLNWKALWNAKAIPRVKETIWRACKGILPCKQILMSRGISEDDICPCCGEESESILHALVQCREVQLLWFASPFGLHICNTAANFQTWFTHCFLSSGNKEAIGHASNILWAIWNRRNQWLFNNRRLSIQQTLCKADSVMITAEDNSVDHDHPPPRWKKPTLYHAKANLDASIRMGAGTGWGVIFRDGEGAPLAAATYHVQEVLDPDIGEVCALRWAIDLALELGFSSVHFETDCLKIHNAWRKKTNNLTYFGSLIEDCRVESRYFDACFVSFINRSCNKVADCLATKAFYFHNQVWLDEFPADILELIELDVAVSP